MQDYARVEGGCLLLECHVQPGAAIDEVAGIHGDRLRIRIASPPVDGKANDRLIRFLARRLGVAKSRVILVRGRTGRRKTVRVEQMNALPENFP